MNLDQEVSLIQKAVQKIFKNPIKIEQ
jgi:hypothetical protein